MRRTAYDTFVDQIRTGTSLAGLLMTPDAAFGFERRGTPDALTALGADRGFDVVVVPPFTVDDRPVSSSAIRAAIAAGDFAAAAHLLGRPFALRGEGDRGLLHFSWPMAMPPDGEYRCMVDGLPGIAAVRGATVRVPAHNAGRVRVEFVA